MKKILSLFALTIALASAGCSGLGGGVGRISKNLAKDPAIVVVRLGTPWGTESFTRVGGQNDNVTVSPDGSITIIQTKTNATSAPLVATIAPDGTMTLPAAQVRQMLAQRQAAPVSVTTNAPAK